MFPNREVYPFEKNNNKNMQKLFKISFLKHFLLKVVLINKDTSELIDFLKQLLNIIFYLLDLPWVRALALEKKYHVDFVTQDIVRQ